MSTSDTTRFYAGLLELGEKPDWPHVAKTIDLLRANGVTLEAQAAVEKDGNYQLPFLVRAEKKNPLLDTCPNPRKDIEALCGYKLGGLVDVDPRKAGPATLRALVTLSNDRHDPAPTRATDLMPHAVQAGCPESAFDGLVGLAPQRRLLQQVGTLVARHGRGVADGLHMAFMGAPGTGKTELARRLLAYFDALGVTSGDGVFVRACAADLVGRYVGSTPARTRAAVERAYGGILFVDEAYALMDSSSYGQEAIDTLVECLDERREDVVCVMAGYPDEMNQLFERNPGLRDRMAFRVPFSDYTDDELLEIFVRMTKARGFTIDAEARAAARDALGTLRGCAGFANARTARRLLGRCLLEAAEARMESRVTAADVRAAMAEPDMDVRPARAVGFQ